MGILELIGVMLLSFVLGVWIKDWGLERTTMIYTYIKEWIASFLPYLNPWHTFYQQALLEKTRQIAALDTTVRAMDDARNALHKAISQNLVPKIKSQEILVNTLTVALEERTAEKSLAAAQLRDTMQKLEYFIGEKRVADAKIMTLEGDVDFLRAHVSALKKANETFVTPATTTKRLRKYQELVNLKRKKS